MLRAYCDESGLHGSSEVLSISGYIGEIKEWRALEAKWKTALHEEHLPGFHSAQCEGGFDDFDDMPVEERHRLQRLFIGIINQHALHAVSMGLNMADYNALKPELAGLRGTDRYDDSPYFTVFEFAIAQFFEAADRYPGRQKVSFVFDRHQQYQSRASEMYRQIAGSQASYRDRVGKSEFANKQVEVALQAADILAYESYRFAKECILPKADNPRWQLQLIAERPLSGKWLDASGMKMLIDLVHKSRKA